MAKAPRSTFRLIDRLVLLVAWLATSAVVYVMGYYVGQGTTDRRAATEERVVRLPVTSTPPPEGQRPKESKDFPSFYQALPAGQRPIDVARGTPVTAPHDQPSETPPPRPTTTVAPRAASTTTTVVRTATTLPRAMPTTTETSLPRLPVTTTTLPRPTTPPRPTSPPTPPPRATPTTTPVTSAPPTTVPRTASRGAYTVEASPTRSRSEAEQLLGTLRRRGYDAQLVQVERDGDTWYRLRVGRYATSAEATDAMRRLRDVEGVTHVFVAAE